MTRRNATTLLTVALSMLLLGGCGRGMPAHVAGRVTLDGQPLDVGTVAFHPTGDGTTVASVVDARGNYALQTGLTDGLLPGEYRVTVTAVSNPPSPTATAEEIAALFLTPRRYSDPATSGIICVVEKGSTTFDISLTSR